MQESRLFSGQIYTAGTNFTRPPVATVVTNLNFVVGAHSNCSKIFEILIGGDGGVLASTSHQEGNSRDVCLQIFLAIRNTTLSKDNWHTIGIFKQFQIYEENVIKNNLEKFISSFCILAAWMVLQFRTKMIK